MWEEHLKGHGAGLGVIPLLVDDTVWWAVIDIDVIGIDHAELEKKIKRHKLPLVVCRSKSGGAHCFVFFKEPAPASEVVPLLGAWAARLGHGGCEIFPKQTNRVDENDLGNWLNMPYFFIEHTTRYGIKDGEQLSLEQFLEHANASKVTLAEVQNIGVVDDDPDGLFADGPPCLQTLHADGGFPQGTRNDGMYNVAVYCGNASRTTGSTSFRSTIKKFVTRRWAWTKYRRSPSP
jgi:hypothetical protein